MPHLASILYQIKFLVMDSFRFLFGRCLPGYPFKCPKLQITPENGLSKSDADKLLALLCDQARVKFFPVFVCSVRLKF